MLKKTDSNIEKIIEILDCSEAVAKQARRSIDKDVLEKILNSKSRRELEEDYVKCEQDIEKQNNDLKQNKAYIDANDKLKLLRSGHNSTIKPYKLANKLRLKKLESLE